MLPTIFYRDSEITPSFAENTMTELKKNYLDLYPWADYLHTGASCLINECGLFNYPVGVRQSKKIDETEWCEVEVIDTSKFGDNLTAYVKACDLENVE